MTFQHPGTGRLRENVTLCECCIISGKSSRTYGTGQLDTRPVDPITGERTDVVLTGGGYVIILVIGGLCFFIIYVVFKDAVDAAMCPAGGRIDRMMRG